jgi:GNAT superfamily N-acetyltransferase
LGGRYEYEWHLGGFSSNNDKLLDECSSLFSDHYGVWSKESPYRSGERIRLSKGRIKKWLENPDSALYAARDCGKLVGYAIALRLRIERCGVVSWITQLVVHSDYRNQNVAKNILHSIWGFSDDFAWGLISASPYAVRALEKATRRRCDPARIKSDIVKIIAADVDNVLYIRLVP